MNKIEIINFSINYYDKALELWKKSEGVGLSSSDDIEDLEMYIEHNQDYSFLALLSFSFFSKYCSKHIDEKYRKRISLRCFAL